jgi:hypothetical protein
MFESGDGFRTAATLQYAGSVRRPPAGALLSGLKGPAGTDSAAVIVVSGSASAFNPSHAVAAFNIKSAARVLNMAGILLDKKA